MYSSVLRVFRLIVFLILVAVANASGLQPVVAQEATPPAGTTSPAFAISPDKVNEQGYVALKGNPGEQIALDFTVLAINSSPLTIRAFATNAESGTNGGFVAAESDTSSTSPAIWMTIDSSPFGLEKNEKHKVGSSIAIPSDATPGDYPIAVVAETVGQLSKEASSVQFVVRSATLVVLTIPGPSQSGFSLGTPVLTQEPGVPTISIPVTNTGTNMIWPQGQIMFKNEAGKVISTTDVKMRVVFPGQSTSIAIALPAQTPLGTYTISGDLHDEQSRIEVAVAETAATLEAPKVAESASTFSVNPVTIEPVGSPVQFANVAITVNNAGQAIATAKVVLQVTKDGEPVEDYPLAQGQALPTGATQVSQRYIPATGWSKGTWGFTVVIVSVSGTTETVIATVPVDTTIVVP